MTGLFVSYLFLIVEPISLVLLAFYTVHHPAPLLVRVGYIGVAAGLALHAIAQYNNIMAYTPPRTWLWVPLLASVNWIIWAMYLNVVWRRWAANFKSFAHMCGLLSEEGRSNGH